MLGKLPLAAIGTLATQFFRGDKKNGKGRRGQVPEKEGRSISAPASPTYDSDSDGGGVRQQPLDEKRRLSDRPSGRSSRGRHSSASSVNTSSSNSRRHALPQPPPSTRHALKSSRESSYSHSESHRRHSHALHSSRDSGYHSDRSRYSSHAARRAGSRNRERVYDSGYASVSEDVWEGASEDTSSYRSRSPSRHGTSKKGARSRKGRY